LKQLIPSFEMVWVLSCSILRGGLVFDMFHPSRWLREPSEGRKLLVLKSISPSQALVSPRIGPSEVVCEYFRERLPTFFANFPRSRDFVFFARHGLWRKAAMLCGSVSPLPCSLALKTFVMYTFLVCDIHFGLSRRFLGFDSF